jgi:hypothetical protein
MNKIDIFKKIGRNAFNKKYLAEKIVDALGIDIDNLIK